jgi:hypothetical protein
MIRQFTNFYCRRCHQVRRFTRRCSDSRRHLMATVLTLGLWGIVWHFFRRWDEARRWHCCICSTFQEPMEEPAEARTLRQQRASTPDVPILPRQML